MEAEAEAMAAVTGIHLDLEASLPGGRCHYRTLGATFPNYQGKNVLARSSPGAWLVCSITSRFQLYSQQH